MTKCQRYHGKEEEELYQLSMTQSQKFQNKNKPLVAKGGSGYYSQMKNIPFTFTYPTFILHLAK